MSDEFNPYKLSHDESIRVDILNNVVEQMKIDLIEMQRNFLWQDDKPISEYERGVLNAIRLIQSRIHMICDL
jgi:hypothetical protein